jgi:hypothetical protein
MFGLGNSTVKIGDFVKEVASRFKSNKERTGVTRNRSYTFYIRSEINLNAPDPFSYISFQSIILILILILYQHTLLHTTRLQLALLSNHALALVEPLDAVIDHLVHDSLGALLLVDNSGGLAHEEGTGVVHGLVINVVAHSLKVVLHGDLAARGQLLDLLGTVVLPVGNVGVVADTERSALFWG